MKIENYQILELIKKSFEYENNKQYKKAIELLYQGLTIEPDNFEILLQIATLYFKMGNYDTAKDYLYKVFLINKNSDYAIKLLIEICIKTKDKEGFIQTVSNLDFDNLSTEILNIVSEAFIYFELYNEFLEIFKNIDESKIQNSKTLYYFALSYYLNKNYEKAKQYTMQSLNIDKKNNKSMLLLANIFYKNKDFEKMIDVLNNVDKTGKNAYYYFLLGLLNAEKEDFQTSIKNFDKAIQLDSSNIDFYYNLATTYYMQGWLPEALKTLAKAKAIKSDNIDCLYLEAEINYSLKKYDIAILHIESILEKDEQNLSAQILKTKIFIEKQQYEIARKNLLDLISKHPNNDVILKLLFDVYYNLRLYSKALSIAEKLLEIHKNTYYIYCLSKCYYNLHKRKEALELLLNLPKQDTNTKEILELLIQLFYEENDLKKTEKYAYQLINIIPDSDLAYYMLAKIYIINDFEKAIKSIKMAISFNPKSSEYYTFAGDIYTIYDDYNSAFQYYQEAFLINENYENAIKLLKSTFTLNDEKLSEKIFLKVKRVAPFDLDLNFIYAEYLTNINSRKAKNILKNLQKNIKDKTLKAIVKLKIKEIKN